MNYGDLLKLEHLVRFGGVLQLGVLTASALVPNLLDWRGQLASADRLVRQLFWAYAGYVVLMITSLGLLTLAMADTLTTGTTLARTLTGFIALFWGVRLALQLFVFDTRPYLKTPLLRLGHHGLTAVFAYLTIVFTWATLA